MTSRERRVSEVDWDTIQEVAGKTELSRLEALSDEELDRELREGGIDPEAADRIMLESLSKTASGAPAPKEVPLQVVGGEGGDGGKTQARVGRSRSWAKASGGVAATALSRVRVIWGAGLAAAAALAVVFGTLEGPAIVAWWRGAPSPSPTVAPKPAPEPPRELVRAEALRSQAERACGLRFWSLCEEKLDQAVALNPAGESQPRVVEMRADIRASRVPNVAFPDSKCTTADCGQPSPRELVAPPEPDPVPYDLAADLGQRTALAHQLFGESAPVQVEGDVFVFAARERNAMFEQSLQLARTALEAFYNGRFSRRPSRAISVYLFDAEKPFHALCWQRLGLACDSSLGFYDHLRREAGVNAGPGITTLTHELAHALVHVDFPDAPLWLNEGIAALFENPVFPQPGEIHGKTNWRRDHLRAALSSPSERASVRLDRLFGMSVGEFGAHRDLNDAITRYVCQWLDERGQLWPFYHAWRDGLLEDPTGEKAFTAVVGMTPAEANDAWIAWVRKL